MGSQSNVIMRIVLTERSTSTAGEKSCGSLGFLHILCYRERRFFFISLQSLFTALTLLLS
jgi:hypothetical protein